MVPRNNVPPLFKPTSPSVRMSLGFNQNRKHRTSTLPGAVNAVTPTRRTATTPAVSVLFSHPTTVASTSSRRRSPPSTKPVVSSPEPVRPPPSTEERVVEPPPPPPSEEAHVMYATVGPDGLVDLDTGEGVASAAERVVVVYPMKADGEDGVVSMRVKQVHPVTGQLRYSWVAAYDPNSETRHLKNFSLLP